MRQRSRNKSWGNRKRTLQFEPLAARIVFASDWQNSLLACDVDHNQSVTPIDVLILINSINRDGDRLLGARSDSNLPYYDVDGDEHLTSVDILRVINVINRAMPELALSSSLSPTVDLDSNGSVASSSVEVRGQTGIGSHVRIDAVDGAGSSTFNTTVQADGEGAFVFTVPLANGLNRVRMQITDELGRTIDQVGEVRRGDLIENWNASLLNVIRRLGSGTTWTREQSVAIKPPGVARNLAMLYTAMFDAMNAVDGTYQGFSVNLSPQTTANANAAAAAAAYKVATSIYSDSISMGIWDATYSESLRDIPDGPSKQAGIALGTSVAISVLQSRSNDGAFASEDRTYSQDPGKWHLAPEDSEAILPQWPSVTPFVIASANDYLPAPPPALGSSEYADALNQVMSIGSKTSTTRTSDQTAIARFWADGAGTASPPGHWNQIAADYLAGQSLSLLDKVRAMALMNLAMADAGIVCWDAKYQYELWRPIDAINRADVDSNSATTADTAWQPLLKTPAFPSYSSGHSSFSGAASAVLTALFGDSAHFHSQGDLKSGWAPTTTAASTDRVFASFGEAADEAGLSRIYGGIHYSFDNTAGLSSGRDIGNFVVAHAMQPKSI